MTSYTWDHKLVCTWLVCFATHSTPSMMSSSSASPTSTGAALQVSESCTGTVVTSPTSLDVISSLNMELCFITEDSAMARPGSEVMLEGTVKAQQWRFSQLCVTGFWVLGFEFVWCICCSCEFSGSALFGLFFCNLATYSEAMGWAAIGLMERCCGKICKYWVKYLLLHLSVLEYPRTLKWQHNSNIVFCHVS